MAPVFFWQKTLRSCLRQTKPTPAVLSSALHLHANVFVPQPGTGICIRGVLGPGRGLDGVHRSGEPAVPVLSCMTRTIQHVTSTANESH